jgi:hypothetical protein
VSAFPDLCERPVCPDTPIVGYGSPPVYLCSTHFHEALAQTREMIKTLLAQMPPTDVAE